nr:Rz1 family lipoprotein [Pantoea cypripedii]
MRCRKTKLCVVLLPLVIVACSSTPKPSQIASPAQTQQPAPAAWAMQPKSTSLQTLDSLFSTSAPESSVTRQK